MAEKSGEFECTPQEHIRRGLNHLQEGRIPEAIEDLFHAAVGLQKLQDFRQIPALWEAIAKLSQLPDNSSQTIDERWPIDFHIKETDEWQATKDPYHRLAWVYLWAAEARELVGHSNMAFPLYFKSAINTEQAEDGKAYPDWPARTYLSAVVNFIRTFGTIEQAPNTHYITSDRLDKEHIKEGVEQNRYAVGWPVEAVLFDNRTGCFQVGPYSSICGG